MGYKETLKKAFRVVFRNNSYIMEQNKLILERLDRLERLIYEDPQLVSVMKSLEQTRRGVDHLSHQFAYANPEYAALPTDEGLRVLVCGYYGDYNLGDEMMLDTLLAYLSEIPGLSVTVMLADNEDFDPFERAGIHFIHFPQNRFDYDRLSSHFDVVFFGGGALLDDGDYDKIVRGDVTLSTTLLELSAEMIEKGKKCLWIGLSANIDVRDPAFIARLREILPKLTYCSFRDTRSIQSLKNAGVDVSSIQLDHDLILANKALLQVPDSPHDGIRVGVILMQGFPELEETYRRILGALLKRLEGEGSPFRIDLIPFFGRSGCDDALLERLAAGLGSDHVVVRPFTREFDQVVSVFAEQDRIISMRYHGALLALLLGKPLLSLVFDAHPHYPNKMTYVREKYDDEDIRLTLSAFSDEDLDAALSALFSKAKVPDNTAFLREAEERLPEILREHLQ